VKPINEGSSVGVAYCQVGDNVSFNEMNWQWGETVLAERYIPGREITVAVLDDKALGCLEIRSDHAFFDYTAKYTAGEAVHLMPAPIHPEAYKLAMEYALKAHKVIGCRGLTRCDFRYDDTAGEPGKIYLLEINTQPGMTPLSLCPEIAAHGGMDYDTLVERCLQLATLDHAAQTPAPSEVAYA
jgi:D-alanine-D-alanine ligase